MVAEDHNPAYHEFHMSSCEIDFNKEEESVQVTLHIFIDDLELALKKRGIDSLFLCTEREAAGSEIQIAQYIDHVLQISLDGKRIHPTMLGKEVSDDLAVFRKRHRIFGSKSNVR